MDEISKALDATLAHVGLPLYPQVPTQIARAKFAETVAVFSRALMGRGIRLRPGMVSEHMQSRGYYYLPAAQRPVRIAPVTIRTRIDDTLTDVLSQRGLPASQISNVQLRGYAQVVSQTETVLARKGYVPGRLAIAAQLQKRRYLPVEPKRPSFEEAPPWDWRLTIAGTPRAELLSTPRGIFTGRPMRVYPLVVRGIA